MSKAPPYTLWPFKQTTAHIRSVREDQPRLVGRLTITYHDIYNRTHASVYDCTDKGEWISRVFAKDIPHDLSELDHEARRRIMPPNA